MKNNPLHNLTPRGNVFWVRFTTPDGNRIEQNTFVPTDDPKEAMKTRDRILAPFQLKNKSDALAVVRNLIEETDTAQRAAEDATNRLKIADAWAAHPYTETSGKGLKKGIRKLTGGGVGIAQVQWNRFVGWAKSSKFEYMDQVQDKQAKAYGKFLVEEGLAGSTQNKYLNTAGVMFRNATGRNPFQSETVPRRENNYQSRRAFTPKELKTAWETLDRRIEEAAMTWTNKRNGKPYEFSRKIPAEETAKRIEDKKLVALMLYTGMRLGDCVQLKGENLTGGMVRTTTDKDKKNLTLPIVPKLAAFLGKLPPKDKFVLPLLAEEYLRDNDITYKRVSRLLDACGFERTRERKDGKNKVSVLGGHAFRHTFVQLVRDAGVDVEDVRRWLGHSSSIITNIYNQNPASSMKRVADAIGKV